MAYIPEQHKKYGLLPRSAGKDWEVFSYSSNMLDELEKLLPEEESFIPYGYGSVEEYLHEIDAAMRKLTVTKDEMSLFESYKENILARNEKENWSVLRYIGKTTDDLFGLTHNQTYYWPSHIDCPSYEGVIDDEEWTSYWYPTEPDDWEILEDPTGMAFATIYKRENGFTSREDYQHAMNQLNNMETP